MADTPSRGGVAGRYLTTSYSFGPALFGTSQGQSSGWFGPSSPMAPSAPPEVAGRQFDYPAGFNLNTRPRSYEAITFATLRDLADGYDLLRTVIETRKDQLARMSWSIKSRHPDASDDEDGRVKALTTLLRRPDGTHGWGDWLRMVLEDLFVIDAPSLYLQRDRGGRLIQIIPLDGATIKPVIDDWGRTPQPYSDGSALVYPPAYQQVLKGLPAVDYSTRDLLYRPRNRRVHTPYGMSPVEQIVTTVNIALRRQLSTLSYFTEGNIPDMIVQVPKEWTPDQIIAYQKHWDAYFSGDLGRRRRAKFTPGVGQGGIHETRQIDLKGEFDEWLAKLVCFAFSISPQALTRQMNRASADTQKELAEEEGLEPILLWLKSLIDDILAFEFGAEDLEFDWHNDDEVDEAQKLNVITGYTSKGLMTIDEGRQQMGLDPFNTPESTLPMVLTGSGYVPLGAWQQQQDAAAAQAQMMADAAASQPAGSKADHDDVPPRSASDARDATQRQIREAADVTKYSADQVRDERGRWASQSAAAPPHLEPLTTREKVSLSVIGAGIAALAIGASLHRRRPYKAPGASAMLAATKIEERRKVLRQALEALHKTSLHTPISAEESAALKWYSVNSYSYINRNLRLNRKPSDEIRLMDAAIEKSALSENTVLYRGLNLDRSKRIITKTQPGDTFVDRGFASTTISEDIARDFASRHAGAGTEVVPDRKHGYVLSINADKGASALPLTSSHTASPKLFEVLLPRSSAFKVLSVDHDSKMIYAQHLGIDTSMRKSEGPSEVEGGDDEPDVADRFVWNDKDIEVAPRSEDDTTADDYAGYTPPQPGPNDPDFLIAKAFDPSQPRDDDGKWTGDDASAKSWAAAEHEAMLIIKGTAIVAGAALALFFAPEIAAAAGAVAGGVAVETAVAAAIPWIASQANIIANGFFGSAAYQAGLSIAKSNGYDTSKVEEALRPFTEPLGIYSKAAKNEAKAPDARFRKALYSVVDKASDELLAAAKRKAPDKVDDDHVEAVTRAVEQARDDFKRDVIDKLGKGAEAFRYRGFDSNDAISSLKMETAPTPSIRAALCKASDHTRDELVADIKRRYQDADPISLKATIDAIKARCTAHKIEIAKFGLVAKAFDPHQARDEKGRWTSGSAYPLADRESEGWYSDSNYESTGGRMVHMAPEEFLRQARPMQVDNLARENIDDLKAHIRGGGSLDPLALYSNGKEDGRHRAHAAIELGIKSVPVLVWTAKKSFSFHRAFGGYRRPDPVPFDRPATRRAEKRIAERLTKVFAELARDAGTVAMASLGKLAKAEPEEPEEPEDRARRIADEVASEFDMSALRETAEPIGEDLEDVASDSVHRAVAQIGPDDTGDLVDQVNARAVAAARNRAAELVGMVRDEDGNLVPSRNPQMAITDTTREELRQTIADGLANNLSTTEIADEIAKSYAFSAERAALIAATEVSRANSEAALASYQAVAALGVVVRKEWLAIEGCCPICAANAAAGPIDLDEEFPSGDLTVPAHPGDRCSIGPVVGDDPAEKAYDPNQVRDERGRWSRGLDAAIRAAIAKHPGVVRATASPVFRPAYLSKIAGVDVRGFRHTISSQGIAHAIRKHGNKKYEAARGQVGIVVADFELVRSIVREPDKVEAGEVSRANNQPRLVFCKKINHFDYTYVAEVQARQRRIEMVSMWKK